MRHLYVLVTVLVVGVSVEARAQQFLNLDFEHKGGRGARGWYTGGAGFEVTLDSTVAYTGSSSLRITRVGEGSFGVATSSFPIEDAEGKRVRYSGYIRTDAVSSGYAGLWWRVDGDSGTLAFDNMAGRGPSGTTPWTRYEIELNVDTAVRNINFGVLMPAAGTAWFDALQVELDGEVYAQPPPESLVPTEEQLAWVRDRAIAFHTAEPGGGIDDLMELKAIVKDARIVSLGEGTHGTAEFFRMKHRITEFLAKEMGFTVFAIEANMPEARRVNRYVLTGMGDPKEALAGMYFWTWNTQEVLDMIEWMREVNSSGNGRIEFWGFDMQTPTVAMDSVRSFVARAEPAYSDSVERLYEKVAEALTTIRSARGQRSTAAYSSWREAAGLVVEHLQQNRESYLERFEPLEVDWAIQNARIVLQGGQTLGGGPSRDESMADNVDWILAQAPPETKIVLWAHNGHVNRGGARYRSMGTALAERHGDDMVVFGFAFHDGEYSAVGDQGLGTYTTSPSEPGSVEWAMHLTGLPRLVLDLRLAEEGSEVSGWLTRSLDFRSIGAMAMEYAFYPTVITEQFDALVYFDMTNPSVLLRTQRP
jgi:erythromycin esterase